MQYGLIKFFTLILLSSFQEILSSVENDKNILGKEIAKDIQNDFYILGPWDNISIDFIGAMNYLQILKY